MNNRIHYNHLNINLIFIGYGENHLIVPTYDFIIRLDMIINQEAILMILHIL